MPSEAYRFTIEGIARGNHVQNVLHFLCDNNDDATPLSVAKELVNAWITDFASQWAAFNSDRYSTRWVQAYRIIPKGGNSWWKEFPDNEQPGALNDDIGVVSLAPIVKLFGGVTDGVQGRCYLPPPGESSVVENTIDTDYSTAVIACFNDLISFSGGTHDFALAIHSPTNGQAVPVTTVAMSPILGTQKRRRIPL